MLLALHLLSLAFVFIVIFFADKAGLAWMRGVRQTISARELAWYHYLVWAGLAAMIGTGTFLFWPLRDYLLQQPLFIAKMACVAALFGNAFIIDNLTDHAEVRPYAALTREEKIPFFISGAVSIGCWLGAASISLYLFGWSPILSIL